MSRSYKKNPWATDHHVKSTKEKKKFANKKVRHSKHIPNGSSYKKLTESWDICDFKFTTSWLDAKKEYENGELSWRTYQCCPTIQSWYRHWYKCYKMK